MASVRHQLNEQALEIDRLEASQGTENQTRRACLQYRQYLMRTAVNMAMRYSQIHEKVLVTENCQPHSVSAPAQLVQFVMGSALKPQTSHLAGESGDSSSEQDSLGITENGSADFDEDISGAIGRLGPLAQLAELTLEDDISGSIDRLDPSSRLAKLTLEDF